MGFHKSRPAAFGRLCVETNSLIRASQNSTQPPSGGCVLKQRNRANRASGNQPAAFGRLCVETWVVKQTKITPPLQPPSGGCVLKPARSQSRICCKSQPPSGGCVLKLKMETRTYCEYLQPPSGGCVLKRYAMLEVALTMRPAAFGRLCVETAHTR